MDDLKNDNEMKMQAIRNGFSDNPNHSNERYKERPAMEVKKQAFESKHGYSGSHKEKMKDDAGMGGVLGARGQKDCY